MKTSLLLFNLLFFNTLCVLAQTPFTQYFDSSGKLTKKENAAYYEVGSIDAGGQYTGKYETFFISGEKRSEGNYSKGKMEGLFIHYFKDGKIKAKETFKDGRYFGMWQEWYQNGQMKEEGVYSGDEQGEDNYLLNKRYTVKNTWDPKGTQMVTEGNGFSKTYNDKGEVTTSGKYQNGKKTGEWKGFLEGKVLYSEKYENGNFLSGITYINGQELPYNSLNETGAQPIGGYPTFYKFLRENLKYPKLAKKNKIEGKVYVQFIVEKNGSISTPLVIRGIGGGCDQEAVRLMKMAPKWFPGTARNIPVKQRVVLPISFNR